MNKATFRYHRAGSVGEALTELILEVFRLNGRLLAAGDRLVGPLGLTSARWQVLGAIDEAPLSVAQIARAMGLARQSVQRIADVLAEEGIVAYADNPQHKRAKLVVLTRRGRNLLDRVSALQVRWAKSLAVGEGRDALKQAGMLLRRLRERLEDVEEQAGGA